MYSIYGINTDHYKFVNGIHYWIIQCDGDNDIENNTKMKGLIDMDLKNLRLDQFCKKISKHDFKLLIDDVNDFLPDKYFEKKDIDNIIFEKKRIIKTINAFHDFFVYNENILLTYDLLKIILKTNNDYNETDILASFKLSKRNFNKLNFNISTNDHKLTKKYYNAMNDIELINGFKILIKLLYNSFYDIEQVVVEFGEIIIELQNMIDEIINLNGCDNDNYTPETKEQISKIFVGCLGCHLEDISSAIDDLLNTIYKIIFNTNSLLAFMVKETNLYYNKFNNTVYDYLQYTNYRKETSIYGYIWLLSRNNNVKINCDLSNDVFYGCFDFYGIGHCINGHIINTLFNNRKRIMINNMLCAEHSIIQSFLNKYYETNEYNVTHLNNKQEFYMSFIGFIIDHDVQNKYYENYLNSISDLTICSSYVSDTVTDSNLTDFIDELDSKTHDVYKKSSLCNKKIHIFNVFKILIENQINIDEEKLYENIVIIRKHLLYIFHLMAKNEIHNISFINVDSFKFVKYFLILYFSIENESDSNIELITYKLENKIKDIIDKDNNANCIKYKNICKPFNSLNFL